MLCEFAEPYSLLTTYIILAIIGSFVVVAIPAVLFYFWYIDPTYEMWTRKTIPWYPKPETVRDEILQSIYGACASTIPPT